MTPKRKRRLIAVLAVVIGVGIATAMAVTAFRSNMLYFVTPSEVYAGEVATGTGFRVGGMVVEGSVRRDPDSLRVDFDLTDHAHSVPITYEGILPDLFREGQGIVAQGELNEDGVFIASQVLAKHDENYMPPEVTHSLESARKGDGP